MTSRSGSDVPFTAIVVLLVVVSILVVTAAAGAVGLVSVGASGFVAYDTPDVSAVSVEATDGAVTAEATDGFETADVDEHNETNGEQNETDDERPADPDNDTVGYWDGYWYDDDINVTQADGLTDDELEEWTARSMARVEYIRGLPFEDEVDLDILTREEYVEEFLEDPEREQTEEYWDWNSMVWRAMFVVGDDADLEEEFDTVRGEAVGGLYDPEDERIVLISDDPDDLVVDNSTLMHEYLHALQDQHYNLTQEYLQPPTQDQQLARNGLIEGDAVYLEEVYAEYCETEWDCVEVPDDEEEEPEEPAEFNLGLWVTIFQPYSDGPQYVAEILETEGQEGLDERFDDPPATSSEIIHPKLEGELPEPMEFEDTAQNGWSTFDEGEDGADRLGEASIYAMFWYQTIEHDIGIIDLDAFFQPDGEYQTYNYVSPVSDGWTNDVIVPYERDGELGYVWQTQWETEEDAELFKAAHEAVLQGHGATEAGPNTWINSDDSFPGAYHLDRDGTTVTVIHGPEVATIEDLRADIDVPVEAVIEERFETVDASWEERFAEAEDRYEAAENRLDERIDEAETTLEERIEELTAEVEQRFEELDQRFEEFETGVEDDEVEEDEADDDEAEETIAIGIGAAGSTVSAVV